MGDQGFWRQSNGGEMKERVYTEVCAVFLCEWAGVSLQSWPWLRARPYRYERVIPLFRGGGRVRVRLLALRLLAAAAAAAGRLLGPLLQTPLVQADRLPPLYLQLLGVRLLVPVLAVYVVSPAALYPLPQPLHHRAVLRYTHRSGGHHAPGGRVHAVVDADTAVGSGSGGGEVPHHWAEWLLFWKNFSPRQAHRHRRHHLLLLQPPPPPPPSVLSLPVLPRRRVPSSRAADGRYDRLTAAEAGKNREGLKGCEPSSHKVNGSRVTVSCSLLGSVSKQTAPENTNNTQPEWDQSEPQTEFNNEAAATLLTTTPLGKKTKTHNNTVKVWTLAGTLRSYTHKPSRGGAAAAAAATVHSPFHGVVLWEKVLLPEPNGLRSFPVNLHLIWFWFERNPGEDVVELGERAQAPSVVRLWGN